MTQDFWNDRFHWCALAAGFLAASEGRLEDSAYVRELAYRCFEEGAFRERVSRPDSDPIEGGSCCSPRIRSEWMARFASAAHDYLRLPRRQRPG